MKKWRWQWFICVLLLPSMGAYAQIDGRVSDNQHIQHYGITVEADVPVVVQVTRTSGDLRPIIAITEYQDIQTLLGRAFSPDGSPTATLKFMPERSGLLSLYISRFDTEVGTTIGDYFLQINGAKVVKPVIIPPLPKPVELTPAILLDLTQGDAVSLQGVVADDDDGLGGRYLVYVDETTETFAIAMNRESGDLVPFLGLLDLTDELVRRGTAITDERARMELAELDPGWYFLLTGRFDLSFGETNGTYSLRVVDGE